MKKILIELLLITLSFSSNAQSLDEKVRYLKNSIHPFSNINPTSVDTEELSVLKEIIGTKRIVFLGEESHYDGNTLWAKSKVINYLHQEMGFDVLLIERGIFETNRAWRDLIERKDSTHNVYSNLLCPFGIGHSWQEKELYQYVGKMAFTDKQLIINGLDILETSPYFFGLETDLREAIEIIYKDTFPTEVKEHFRNSIINYEINDIKPKDYMVRKEAGWQFFIDLFKQSLQTKNLSNIDQRKLMFLSQALQSFLYVRHWYKNRPKRNKKRGTVLADYYTLRDEGMAKNLLWYLDEYYPNKKIIVSTSTYHISRNTESIQPRPYFLGKDAVPMGHYVWKEYSDQIYSIAFVAHSGKRGSTINVGMRVEKIKKRKKNGLEDLIHRAGIKYGILDFTSLAGEKDWLKSVHLSATFNESYKTDWSQIYDGLFYIDEMKPSRSFGGFKRKNESPYFLIKPGSERLELK